MTLRWPERTVIGGVTVMVVTALLMWGACAATAGVIGANHVFDAFGRSIFLFIALISLALWTLLRAGVAAGSGVRHLINRHQEDLRLDVLSNERLRESH